MDPLLIAFTVFAGLCFLSFLLGAGTTEFRERRQSYQQGFHNGHMHGYQQGVSQGPYLEEDDQ